MRVGDNSSFHSWTAYNNNFNDIWNYGREEWCNLEGQYMHIVANLTHLEGMSYSMELCQVGIMGT